MSRNSRKNAAPAAAPIPDADSLDSVAGAPPAADAPAADDASPAADQIDADGDGHDDRTGRFVDGNEGRPEVATATETAAEGTGDPVADAELSRLNQQYAPEPQVEETTELVAVAAVHRINGSNPAKAVLPGVIFTPESIEQLTELRGLGAVRNLTEAEAAIFGARSSGE